MEVFEKQTHFVHVYILTKEHHYHYHQCITTHFSPQIYLSHFTPIITKLVFFPCIVTSNHHLNLMFPISRGRVERENSKWVAVALQTII